jgi:hypothetical protein
MQRTEKTFEIALPETAARARWGEFERDTGDLTGGSSARFEPLPQDRTRVTLSGDASRLEGLAEHFKHYIEKTWRARAGLSGSTAAGNPGARGVAPGGAGGAMHGSTGGTPGAGGGKPGSVPGTRPI